jgi:hypothetical protein
VEAETRGVSEDQDYLRNDFRIRSSICSRRDPRSYTKTEDSKDEENTDTLRTTIGGMLNTFDDLGDDIYSDGDDSVYGGTIQTIRNMPYSHERAHRTQHHRQLLVTVGGDQT